jgi:hypothetical protein
MPLSEGEVPTLFVQKFTAGPAPSALSEVGPAVRSSPADHDDCADSVLPAGLMDDSAGNS